MDGSSSVPNATQPPLFLARFSPKFRPFSAIFRPFSPSWRQEARQHKITAEKRRKTGEKRPRNSGLGGVDIPAPPVLSSIGQDVNCPKFRLKSPNFIYKSSKIVYNFSQNLIANTLQTKTNMIFIPGNLNIKVERPTLCSPSDLNTFPRCWRRSRKQTSSHKYPKCPQSTSK